MAGLRAKLNKTQQEVAGDLGITQSSYAMIEGGHRHPRKDMQKKIADYYNVTVDELFYAKENHGTQLKPKTRAG